MRLCVLWAPAFLAFLKAVLRLAADKVRWHDFGMTGKSSSRLAAMVHHHNEVYKSITINW